MQPDDVIAHAEQVFGVTREQLLGRPRQQHVIWARQALMLALRQRYQMSYAAIGQLFDGRDHTTVLDGCHAAQERAAELPRYAAQLAVLIAGPATAEADAEPEPGPAGRRIGDWWWIGLAGYVYRGVRLSA